MPSPRDLVEVSDIPGVQEALLLLDAAKIIHDTDTVIASATARKTMDMAIVSRGLEEVEGLPLLIDPKTRELFGVPDSIWSDQGLPKDVVPMGSLVQATPFGGVLITEDRHVGFERANGVWIMSVRQQDGTFQRVSR